MSVHLETMTGSPEPSWGNHLTANGIFFDPVQPQPTPSARAALFLDRDGVVVEHVHYLCRVNDVRILPGVAKLIRRANTQGIPVVIVTNQAGIGRGVFDWPAFHATHIEMVRQLAADGARLDLTIAVPHHEQGIAEWRHPDHPMRKPNPGMVLAARDKLNLNLGRSVLIGDRVSDLLAGKRAGLLNAIGVGTGYGQSERNEMLALADAGFAVEYLADLTNSDQVLARFDQK